MNFRFTSLLSGWSFDFGSVVQQMYTGIRLSTALHDFG